jgi:hypothetical protein
VVTAAGQGTSRFDGESARSILERAAAEQERRKLELAGSYTFEELQEMAAEAGISREALAAAIAAHERSRRPHAGNGPTFVPRERRWRGLLDVLVPGPWSGTVKGIVLGAAGAIAVVAFALAFPAAAEATMWALLAFLALVALLVALGASPL